MNEANRLNGIAQGHYNQVNAAASVVNSIDGEINAAYQEANLAYEKYQKLNEEYENQSILQWAAEDRKSGVRPSIYRLQELKTPPINTMPTAI